MRGLILQQPFTPNQAQIDLAIHRFGALIAPYLEMRQRKGRKKMLNPFAKSAGLSRQCFGKRNQPAY